MKQNIKVGIPRALLYYKYKDLWETFFKEIGVEVVLSQKTNKKILEMGVSLAIDESCLSTKLFMGHVWDLVGKVDYIFVPRINKVHKGEENCAKFGGLYDIVNNTFDDINLLDYNLVFKNKYSEAIQFIKLGHRLGKGPLESLQAYRKAKEFAETKHLALIKDQDQLAKDKDTLKVLLVSHPYTTYDDYVGKPLIKKLKNEGVTILYSDIIHSTEARELSCNLSKDIYWTYHKDFLGAIHKYRKVIDGILFLNTFPCGPDSLVIDLCQKKISDIPISVITLDEQQGEAGLNTRIESFTDILKLRKKNGQASC